jgi:hypothetical protein
MVSRPAAVALRAVGMRTLVCLGDSHLRPVRILRRERMLPRTAIQLVVVSGASATGIGNLDSETQALRRFRAATARLGRASTVLVSLGEVDVGFLAFARVQGRGGSVRAHADVAFEGYVGFLEAEILRRGARLLVLSVTPPTVQDYSTWTDQQNARRHLEASWAERAELTGEWNDRLGSWCEANGAVWLDMTPHVTEPGTMQVRPEWLNPGPDEQHLHPHRQAALLAKLLREQGFR